MNQEPNALPNGFAPEAITSLFNDAADHSRAYVEKSLRLLQNETLELVNRRIDNNGTAINEYRNCKDFADLMTAQHKWFSDLNRDYYDAWRRFGEATQRLVSVHAEEMRDDAHEMEDAVQDAEHEVEHHMERDIEHDGREAAE
jgi:hypothetical protein